MLINRFNLYILLHLLISFTYLIIFVNKFALPQGTVFLHLQIISLVHLLGYFAFLVLRVVHKKLNVVLISLLMSIYWMYLTLIYVLNWVSNTNWGSNVMFDLIKRIPDQFNLIMEMNNWSFAFVALMMLIGVTTTYSLAYFLLKPGITIDKQKTVYFSRKNVYLAGLTIFILFYISITFSTEKPRQWAFEPVLSSMLENYSVFDTPRSKFEALNDKQVRQTTLDELKQLDFKPQKNVVLVIVDSFRGDMTSAYSEGEDTTPFLRKFVKRPQVQKVKYMISTCPESTCSIYSIFSSRNASRLGLGLYDLSDVLKDAGYFTKYIISARHDYNGLSDFYSKSLDQYITGYDFVDPLSLYDDDGVIKHLREVEFNPEQPQFLYLHLMSAHYLGINKEPFIKHEPQEEFYIKSKTTEDLETATVLSNNAYKNGVLQTDDYLRQIVETLEAKGAMDNTLLVIVGDHGEGLGERGNFSHTVFTYHEDINVPFIMYDSNNSCELKNTEYATQIDIAPTILDCLSMPVPTSWLGRSMVKPYQENRITYHQSIREEREVMVVLENKEHMYKLMATRIRGELLNIRLYDYYNDPHELTNIIDTVDQQTKEKLMSELEQEFLE